MLGKYFRQLFRTYLTVGDGHHTRDTLFLYVVCDAHIKNIKTNLIKVQAKIKIRDHEAAWIYFLFWEF